MSELIVTKKHNEILKLPYLVLTVSLLLTFGASYLFYQSVGAKDTARFQNAVSRSRTSIENKINLYIAMLKAGRGFIESNKDLNRRNFATFVGNLEVEKNYSGVQGIGFTKTIRADERAALINEVRAEGFPDFDIFPETVETESQPIIYVAPFDDRNKKAFGFNMSSESGRREAMTKARRTGNPAASGKIFLIQESEAGAQPGFLIYLPVYKNSIAPPNDADGDLDGFIYGAFRAEDFLKEIQKTVSDAEIAVAVYDNEKSEANLLAATNAENAKKINYFTATHEIGVADRKWIVEFESLPTFEAQSTLGWTPLIFSSGVIFSLLLFAITYLESKARIKSDNIADELRESEREKAFLLEREQKARRAAEQASRAKDEFISIVSHELRTPLNSIAGWSRILQASNITTTTRKQALQKIDKSLRVQTLIIEELLDFSQILSGRGEIDRKRVVFSEVFEEAYGDTMSAAREKEVSLIKENSLNGQEVLGDRERLKKVLKNLLSNAIKFTPRGGEIIAATDERDQMIELRVKDNGKGISPEFLPFVFDRFRQADASSTRQFGGLGLGLAISRHIVELHGGTITAESEGKDKGTMFIVRLPFVKN